MTSQATRWISLETCQNFRDMGGYPTASGRELAWGRLYRADTLHRLTPADLVAIAGLGIRTVVDLRARSEVEQYGRIQAEGQAVTYHHLPMLDEVAGAERAILSPSDDPPTDLGQVYVRMLAAGTPAVIRAFRALAGADALPAVFHCMAGKDRTGILSAVILAALEVPDELIVADYVLTAEIREARTAFLAEHDPEYLLFLASLPAFAQETRAESMEAFLGNVRHRHGSMRAYLADSGVDGDTVDRLAAALLA